MLIPQAKYFTVQVPFEPTDFDAAQMSAAVVKGYSEYPRPPGVEESTATDRS